MSDILTSEAFVRFAGSTVSGLLGGLAKKLDNGPGFVPADNQEPHIALANIRERLQLQGGTLTIHPREEGGTIVKVTIP